MSDVVVQMPPHTRGVLSFTVSRSTDNRWVLLGAEDEEIVVEWRVTPRNALKIAGAILMYATACEEGCTEQEGEDLMQFTNEEGL